MKAKPPSNQKSLCSIADVTYSEDNPGVLWTEPIDSYFYISSQQIDSGFLVHNILEKTLKNGNMTIVSSDHWHLDNKRGDGKLKNKLEK